MLQTYGSPGEAYHDSGGQSLGLRHYLQILRRRWILAAVAFGVVLLLGALLTAIQRPIYQAEGKVLVESQDIPTDLVRPTITDSANQRIQVIQQRIMTRDNLLALVNKYHMFAGERRWMSGTELIDLMRQRTKFELVDINAKAGSASSTIAFTVSFEYENPEITQGVTNDFLTLILKEDAENRTTRATETTNFLTRESQRLQGELAAIAAQIAEALSHSESPSTPVDTTDPAKMQVAELTKLKEDLAQKSSTYSDAHPTIIALKKKIAAMEQLIAKTPTAPAAQAKQANAGLFELAQRRVEAEQAFEENNKKLEAARLGERLERDQRSERLAVIEQPVLPQSPIKPKRLKFLAVSFALAVVAGAGVIFAAESLDGSIRYSHELLGAANGRMIVTIPYIATRAEAIRRKSRVAVVAGIFGVLLLGGLTGLLFFGPPIDLSWINQFWLDHLTRLSM